MQIKSRNKTEKIEWKKNKRKFLFNIQSYKHDNSITIKPRSISTCYEEHKHGRSQSNNQIRVNRTFKSYSIQRFQNFKGKKNHLIVILYTIKKEEDEKKYDL